MGLPTTFPGRRDRSVGGPSSYADDAEVERIGQMAGSRGWYTRAELLAVARWKTRGRSQSRCGLNTDAEVGRATARALTTEDERERVDALVGLHGVGLPPASVLLHLARPRLYPIIDFRALWSLGIDEAPRPFAEPSRSGGRPPYEVVPTPDRDGLRTTGGSGRQASGCARRTPARRGPEERAARNRR